MRASWRKLEPSQEVRSSCTGQMVMFSFSEGEKEGAENPGSSHRSARMRKLRCNSVDYSSSDKDLQVYGVEDQ